MEAVVVHLEELGAPGDREGVVRDGQLCIVVDDDPLARLEERGPSDGAVLQAVAEALPALTPAVRRALLHEMRMWAEEARQRAVEGDATPGDRRTG